MTYDAICMVHVDKNDCLKTKKTFVSDLYIVRSGVFARKVSKILKLKTVFCSLNNF